MQKNSYQPTLRTHGSKLLYFTCDFSPKTGFLDPNRPEAAQIEGKYERQDVWCEKTSMKLIELHQTWSRSPKLISRPERKIADNQRTN
jgi:hypothetical protein